MAVTTSTPFSKILGGALASGKSGAQSAGAASGAKSDAIADASTANLRRVAAGLGMRDADSKSRDELLDSINTRLKG